MVAKCFKCLRVEAQQDVPRQVRRRRQGLMPGQGSYVDPGRLQLANWPRQMPEKGARNEAELSQIKTGEPPKGA